MDSRHGCGHRRDRGYRIAGYVPGDGDSGDAASLPTSPVFPEVQTAVIVGGVVGLGFGIAFALIRTVSDRRIRLTDDVEGKVGLPVVGTLANGDRPKR